MRRRWTDTFFFVIIIDFTHNCADQLSVMAMTVTLYFEEAGGYKVILFLIF